MLDGITIDQLRTFLAAVDQGSFSAAGRSLGRAQSVVSQTLATVEDRLGVRLFDRTRRYPTLTAQGRSLVADARAVLGAMDLFKGRAQRLSEGLEPEVAVTVDVMVPFAIVTRAVAAFEAAFPSTALRLSIEALGAVVRPVIAGDSVFAIAGPLAAERPDLVAEAFPGVAMCAVTAPDHALARVGQVSVHMLSAHRQLVLADRSDLSRDREFGVLSPLTWRLSDLSAKQAFLKEGLGWGAMPRAMIAADLAEGRLIELSIEGADPRWATMLMHAAYRAAHPPGIAGRWLLDRLRGEAEQMLTHIPKRYCAIDRKQQLLGVDPTSLLRAAK